MDSSGNVYYFAKTQSELRDDANQKYVPDQVNIERAFLEFAPYDFAKFKLGKFLTPYGIWNVDHGAPVLISMRLPFFIQENIIPQAITGFQFFGNVPVGSLDVFYHAYIGNKRGVIEDVDNDRSTDEFAGGGRLRIVTPPVADIIEFKLGYSVYYGRDNRFSEFRSYLDTNYFYI